MSPQGFRGFESLPLRHDSSRAASAQERLSLEEWNSGEALWLVELVAPFADAQNNQREIMFADLITGPLARQAFKFHETDPATGERRVRETPADAGERLTRTLEAALTRH